MTTSNLVIESIEMVNVLSHAKTKVNLPLGVTVIVGPNGAGKTSIVDALSYALFSIHSRDPRRREPLIRIGASSATINVLFRIGGKRYRVFKVISRRSPTRAVLYEVEDGRERVIAASASAVKRELERLTGIAAEVARYTVIARQGELDILLVDKSKRVEALDALLGLKSIEKAYDRMRDLIRHYENELRHVQTLRSEKEKQLEQYREKIAEKESVLARLNELNCRERVLEARLEELQKELEKLDKLYKEYIAVESRLDALRAGIESDKRRYEEISARISQLEDTIKHYNNYIPLVDHLDELNALLQLKHRIEEVEAELSEQERVISELRGIEDKLAELEELQRKREEILAELSKLSSIVDEYSAKNGKLQGLIAEKSRTASMLTRLKKTLLARLREAGGVGAYSIIAIGEIDVDRVLALLKHNLAETEKSLEKIEQELNEANKKLAEIKSRMESIGDYLEILTRAAGKCPLCRRPLTEEHRRRLILELGREKRRLEEERRNLLKKIEELNALREREQRQRDTLLRSIESISSIAKEIREYESRLRILEDEIAGLRRELLGLRLDKARYDELRGEERRIASRVRELQVYQDKARQLNYAIKRREELSKKLGELRAEYNAIAGRLAALCRAESVLEDPQMLVTLVEELKEMLSELNSLRENAESLRRGIEEREAELERLSSILSSIKYDARRHQEVKDSIKRLELELRSIVSEKGRVAEKLKLIEEAEQAARSLEAEISRLRDLERRLSSVVRDLHKVRKVLHSNGLPQLIRSRLRELVVIYMRDVLSKFNLGFVDVELDDEFNVTVRTVDGVKTVNMLSGGERIALALAMRLAIARALGSRLGILVLDEPTVYLDEERRRDLVDVLKSCSRVLGVSQIVIVTHDRELEEVADTLLEVRREDGVSKVSVSFPSSMVEEVSSPVSYQ